MKRTVWVVNTCCPGEADPCLPRVFGTEEAAEAYFDEMMRAEWQYNGPLDPEEAKRLPYPDNAAEAHKLIIECNNSDGELWGHWEITNHEVEFPE